MDEKRVQVKVSSIWGVTAWVVFMILWWAAWHTLDRMYFPLADLFGFWSLILPIWGAYGVRNWAMDMYRVKSKPRDE